MTDRLDKMIDTGQNWEMDKQQEVEQARLPDYGVVAGNRPKKAEF